MGKGHDRRGGGGGGERERVVERLIVGIYIAN